jgi:hypothetical protein
VAAGVAEDVGSRAAPSRVSGAGDRPGRGAVVGGRLVEERPALASGFNPDFSVSSSGRSRRPIFNMASPFTVAANDIVIMHLWLRLHNTE